MNFMPPDRAPSEGLPLTRAHAVAAKLRDLIVAGELGPGQRLRQNEVAARLQVSSTPVREAFLLLARRGFVELDTHRGAIVFSPTHEHVRENYEIRAALEALVGELAATKITEGQLEQLEQLLPQMCDAVHNDLAHHTRVLNPRFHAAVYEIAGRPGLTRLIGGMRELSLAYQELLLAGHTIPADYPDRVQAEHEEIVAALRCQDPVRASDACRQHVLNNLVQVLGGLAGPNGGSHPDEGK